MKILLFTQSFPNQYHQTQIKLNERFGHCYEHISISTLCAIQSLFESKNLSSSLKSAAQSNQQSCQDPKSRDHRQVRAICSVLLRWLQPRGFQTKLPLPRLLPKEWFLWSFDGSNHESSQYLKFQSSLLWSCRRPIDLQRFCFGYPGLQTRKCSCRSIFTHVQICLLVDLPFWGIYRSISFYLRGTTSNHSNTQYFTLLFTSLQTHKASSSKSSKPHGPSLT